MTESLSVILRNGDDKTWHKTEDAQMFSFLKHKKVDSRNWRLTSIIFRTGKIIKEIKHIFYQQFFKWSLGDKIIFHQTKPLKLHTWKLLTQILNYCN